MVREGVVPSTRMIPEHDLTQFKYTHIDLLPWIDSGAHLDEVGPDDPLVHLLLALLVAVHLIQGGTCFSFFCTTSAAVDHDFISAVAVRSDARPFKCACRQQSDRESSVNDLLSEVSTAAELHDNAQLSVTLRLEE